MHKIANARALPGYRLSLRFEDGVEGEVDLTDMVGKGVFAAWTDQAAFEKVYVDAESHTVAWPGDIDLCPESLYEEVTAGTESLVARDKPQTGR